MDKPSREEELTLKTIDRLRSVLSDIAKENKSRPAMELVGAHKNALLYLLMTISVFELPDGDIKEPEAVFDNPALLKKVTFGIIDKLFYILNNSDDEKSYSMKVEEHGKEDGISAGE